MPAGGLRCYESAVLRAAAFHTQSGEDAEVVSAWFDCKCDQPVQHGLRAELAIQELGDVIDELFGSVRSQGQVASRTALLLDRRHDRAVERPIQRVEVPGDRPLPAAVTLPKLDGLGELSQHGVDPATPFRDGIQEGAVVAALMRSLIGDLKQFDRLGGCLRR